MEEESEVQASTGGAGQVAGIWGSVEVEGMRLWNQSFFHGQGPFVLLRGVMVQLIFILP